MSPNDRSRTLIYVVHGSNVHTWWRRLASSGYPWWRPWSLFCQALRDAFGDCEIREFRWSGINTHAARTDTAQLFAEALRQAHRPGDAVHVVAHSHGGSVALSAAGLLPAGFIDALVLLASPHMAVPDRQRARTRWLYWDDAAARVRRIWNLYSPEDAIQTRAVRIFNGLPGPLRASLTVAAVYDGPGRENVKNIGIHWNTSFSAHSAMHCAAVGTAAGSLLKGESAEEALAKAQLDPRSVNPVRDHGGWPGMPQVRRMIGERADAAPFDLQTGNEEVAILLVHGFTAAPSEMRPLAEFLRKQTGWRCKSVLLPGHGTRVEDLVRTGSSGWVDAADRAYAQLAAQHRHVFLAGLSLGAVLCCHVALRRRNAAQLRGLILLAPAFGISTAKAAAFRVLRHVLTYRSKGIRAAHYFLDRRLFSYVDTPLKAAGDVLRLGREAWRGLAQLRGLSILMFSGGRDTTVSTHRIAAAARKYPWIRFVPLPNSRHILTVEPDRETLFEKSLDFVNACIAAHAEDISPASRPVTE